MRLISSDLALEAAVALSASTGLPLSQLARAIGVLPSAAQRALEILLEDGIVERIREDRLVYRLRSTETADHVVALAVGEIPLARAVVIAARANPAIEFVARESRTLVTVLSANSTALAQARAARFLETVASRHALEVKYLDHDDVRRALLAERGRNSSMVTSIAPSPIGADTGDRAAVRCTGRIGRCDSRLGMRSGPWLGNIRSTPSSCSDRECVLTSARTATSTCSCDTALAYGPRCGR